MSCLKRLLIALTIVVSLVVTFLATVTVIYRSERPVVKIEGKSVSRLQELDEVRLVSGSKIGVVESVHTGFVIVRINPFKHICSDGLIWRMKKVDGEAFIEMDSKESDAPCSTELKDGLTYQVEENE